MVGRRRSEHRQDTITETSVKGSDGINPPRRENGGSQREPPWLMDSGIPWNHRERYYTSRWIVEFSCVARDKTLDRDGQFKADLVAECCDERGFRTSGSKHGKELLFPPRFGPISGTCCVHAASGNVSRAQYFV